MTVASPKTALITGASSGLGAEFANQLATRGFNLILVARHPDRLQELADSLSSRNKVIATVLPADLSTMFGIEHVISVITDASNLELLVNNAGFGVRGRFYRVDPVKALDLLHVHMIAPVMFCRAALPAMVSRDSGTIINVASLSGLIPVLTVLYGSSKNFLIRFTEAMHFELRDSHIQVQALCPGYIRTEFLDTPEYENYRLEGIPNFLWMTPQRVVSESLQSLSNRKVICIPGNIYKFAGILARNGLTSGLVTWVARLIIHKRKH